MRWPGHSNKNAPAMVFLGVGQRARVNLAGQNRQQLLDVIPASDDTRIRKCVDAAERCFQEADALGNKGAALVWLVTLTRGTGRFDECRHLVRDASADSTIPAKDTAEATKIADGIEAYESDFSRLSSATEGWVVPAANRLFPKVLDELTPIAEEILRSQQEHSGGISPHPSKKPWRRFW